MYWYSQRRKTNRTGRKFCQIDVQVDQWREAGLDRSSTIRLSRLVTVEKSILTRRIGKLSLADASRVRTLWNEKFHL